MRTWIVLGTWIGFGVVVGIFSQTLRASEGYTLVFKDNVWTEQEKISLYELIDPTSCVGSVCDSFKNQIIAVAPEIDSQLQISEEMVRDALRSMVRSLRFGASWVEDRISYKIPSNILVKRAWFPFTEAHFRKHIIETLTLDCPSCSWSLLQVRLPPQREKLKGLRWKIAAGQKLRGPFSVRVDFFDGEQRKGSENVSGEVQWNRKVAVLNRTLISGERVQKEDLSEKAIDVTYWTDSPVEIDEAIGSKLVRNMRQGDPLRKGDLEREWAVRSGDKIQMIVSQGQVQLTGIGVAKKSGRIGDTIEILSLQGEKVLQGTVLEKGRVEVR